MVFSSVTFLFGFLPALLVAYFLTPRRFRNAVLLLASLVFYTWGGGDFVLILFGSTFVDWLLGHGIARGRAQDRPRIARSFLVLSVVFNLSLLVYFKYSNFFVDQVNELLATFGVDSVGWTTVALPIGISFFTFERMSYTIDLYRGHCHAERNPIDFLLFVSLFPRSIAGPIVRYAELEDQLRHHPTRLDDLVEGGLRFSWGLAKKVIVADTVAPIADAAFANVDRLDTPSAWIGIAAYTIQIYFDFSGYSDMAIGLARVFGFRLPENFDRPYSAQSVTDFWRRWHMTLSRWFRDYVYVALGGSRTTLRRTLVNLAIVFVLTGLWHGANWTFLVWGAYHGVLLVTERLTGQRSFAASGVELVVRRLVTFVLVMIGWVFFRADSIDLAIDYLGAMFAGGWDGVVSPVLAELTRRASLVLALAVLVALLPTSFNGARVVTADAGVRGGIARFALLTVALPYAIVLVASGTFSPFLYFQF
ncbi:MAG TPA: MBOAT family protein [Acidimicrobiia bacterium]|nr:MBOAT family protein [Acidimicrobiia bacterium]